jgi:dihydroxy-acid dehydratase
MGAASADIPSIVFPGGPMMAGEWRGRKLGSGTDGRKLYDLKRTGQLSDEQWCEIESCIARTAGHCTVMGTASTMTSLAEALGLALPGTANIPAVDARRMAAAEQAGRRIVTLVAEDLRPSKILTKAAFENAIATLMALGGSTNAVIHLLAIAGRVGVDLTLPDFDEISRRTPFLVNVKPSGEFLMEDLFEAGGVPAVMREILPLLHKDAITVTGHTIEENISKAECLNQKVIYPFANPIHPEGGIVVLHGNLAPDGAVVKQTAASPHLMTHKGRAVVFENYAEMHARINLPDLPVDANSVLVLKNAGPIGGPGFPEWGQIPLPEKLIRAGVTDVVRISDARMSGTSFGTVVLHIAPESAVGGPLSAVRDGDEISLDVPNRRIDLCLPEDEFAQRLKNFTPPTPHYDRGYGKLFLDHVTQANLGCDFDFLRASK